MAENDLPDVDNISEEELYRLGLTYFKENEGRTFHLAYQDKIELVAFTQQANHGSVKNANLPPLGTFDIIGKERRAAWEALGDITKDEAKEKFSSKLLDIAPGFKDYIIVASKDKEEKKSQPRLASDRQHEQGQDGRCRSKTWPRGEAREEVPAQVREGTVPGKLPRPIDGHQYQLESAA